MTRDEIILRGEAAARILSDEVAMSALAAIESDCIESWKTSNPDRYEDREDAFRMHRSVQLLRDKLKAWDADAQKEQADVTWRKSQGAQKI